MKLTNKDLKLELNISKIPLKNFLVDIMEDIFKIRAINEKLQTEAYLSEKYISMSKEIFKINEVVNIKMNFLANSIQVSFKQIDDLLIKVMKNE